MSEDKKGPQPGDDATQAFPEEPTKVVPTPTGPDGEPGGDEGAEAAGGELRDDDWSAEPTPIVAVETLGPPLSASRVMKAIPPEEVARVRAQIAARPDDDEIQHFEEPHTGGDGEDELGWRRQPSLARRAGLHVALPLLVLVGAALLATILVRSRPEASRKTFSAGGALVQTIEARAQNHRLDVQAQGTVIPSRQVTLQPQVSGRIQWMCPQLEIGGIVSKGSALVRIDVGDYDLSVEEAKTNLEQARAQLALEEGQQIVAKGEWEAFERSGGQTSDPSLALRKPQMRIAQSRVTAAEARLRRAALDLSRTTIHAPFNALVQKVSAEVGQLATGQTPVATLVGTDSFWVNAAVPVEQLAYLDIPGLNAKEGSRVRVSHQVGSVTHEREGRVVRLLGDVDPMGRMARILVEVQDPMGLKAAEGEEKWPLLLGSFVSVRVEGNQEKNLVEIPRRAVHDGDQVHIASADGTLQIRPVRIAWRLEDKVLVEQGVNPGERVIVSRMPAPVEGMKLRTAGQDESGDAQGGKP